MKIFSIHDSKAEAYLTPNFFKTTGEALRAFETTTKNPDTQFNKYPHDFTLVEIGHYDELTGTLTSNDKPTILASASEFTSN